MIKDRELQRAESVSVHQKLADLEKSYSELQDACVESQIAGYLQCLYVMLDKIHFACLSYKDFLPNNDDDILVRTEAAGDYCSKLADPAQEAQRKEYPG